MCNVRQVTAAQVIKAAGRHHTSTVELKIGIYFGRHPLLQSGTQDSSVDSLVNNKRIRRISRNSKVVVILPEIEILSH